MSSLLGRARRKLEAAGEWLLPLFRFLFLMEVEHMTPEERARQLLLSYLTEQQREDYIHTYSFIAIAESGNQYLITDQGHAGRPHVAWVGDSQDKIDGVKGRFHLCQFCIRAIQSPPREDTILAIKLLIETDERRFLQIANVTAGYPPRPQRPQGSTLRQTQYDMVNDLPPARIIIDDFVDEIETDPAYQFVREGIVRSKSYYGVKVLYNGVEYVLANKELLSSRSGNERVYLEFRVYRPPRGKMVRGDLYLGRE